MQRIIPQPISQLAQEGCFDLDADCRLLADEGLDFYADLLRQETQLPLSAGDDSDKHIRLQRSSQPMTAEGAYRLLIDEQRILIVAADQAGMFHGVQSLLQLLPLGEKTPSLPCCNIDDAPRFAWRGCLLDCSRHFRSVDFIKRFIEQLARYKFNRFHWHICDDQGWRLQIDAYPQLTEIGAWRSQADGSRHGGFYSKAEVRDIIAFAAERQVMVIPEIDMPGHTSAVVASLPELSCRKERIPVPHRMGGKADVLCAGSDAVYDFAATVLAEVADLFPTPWIHIGGDECIKQHWRNCPACQERIRSESLEDEKGLEHYFISRLEAIVGDLGKRLIGWDEILELDSEGIGHEVAVTYPSSSAEDRRQRSTLIHSWRDPSGVRAALACGHDCIVSTQHSLYLNYSERRLPLEKVYHFDPAFGRFDQDSGLLGIEAALWGEHLINDGVAEQQLYPRLLAAAECAWSKTENKDWPAFRQALLRESKGLRARGFSCGLGLGCCDLHFDPPQPSGLLLHIDNQADEALFLEGHCEAAPGIRFAEEHVEAIIAPGSKRELPLAMRCDDDCKPATSRWRLRYANPIGPDICVERELLIRPETEYHCQALPPELTSPVRIEHWPKLSQDIPDDDGSVLARFDCRHDKQLIHIACQVFRRVGDIDGDKLPWEQAGIEIRLDGRDELSRFHSDGAVEFDDIFLAAMSPGDSVGDYACCYRASDLPPGSNVSCYRNAEGYAAWVAVPIAWLCAQQGERWSALRCNISINDWSTGTRRLRHWRPDWRSADNQPWSGTFFRS